MADLVEIRHVPVTELDAFDRSIRTTFLEGPSSEALTELRATTWDAERTWGAVADGRFVGTLRTFPYRLSIPGPTRSEDAGACVDLDVDGLTAVTVAATHRRQGLLRRMLTDSLTAAHERGDPISILVAAEWAIYGRFGYWPAATSADLRLLPRRPGARLRAVAGGRVRQIDWTEALDLAPAIFEVTRSHRAGHINRDESNWRRRLDPGYRPAGHLESNVIVHEGDAGPDGILVWRAAKDFGWVDGGKVHVNELFATDQAAYTALWGYLLEMDVVDEITIETRPPDEPLPLLLVDGRSVQTASLVDGIWVRILDVEQALSARGYAVAGRLVLDVVDDDIGGFAAGRYVLDTSDEGAGCRREPTATPDLRLSQRALAGVYLGQPSLRAQRAAGLVDELTPGAVARADAMFGTSLAPWVGSGF